MLFTINRVCWSVVLNCFFFALLFPVSSLLHEFGHLSNHNEIYQICRLIIILSQSLKQGRQRSNSQVRVYFQEQPSRTHHYPNEVVQGQQVSRSKKARSDTSNGSSGVSNSSRSSRSARSNVTYSDVGVQVIHVDTTPEGTVYGSGKHAPSSRGSSGDREDDVPRHAANLPAIREERGDNGSHRSHSRSPSVSSKHPHVTRGMSACFRVFVILSQLLHSFR